MRKTYALAAVLLLIFSILPAVGAQCPCEGHTIVLKAPAVSRTPDGRLVGVATNFVITVAPGSGHVYLETWPLAEVDMQASARLATQIAGEVTGKDMSKYDVFIQVRADSPIIGGPSAGGTMTVGIIAALEGWKVRDDVMMTGMINPDGTIGPVGGILEKAAAAASVGAKLFLIPEGQRIQMVQESEEKNIGGIIQITTRTRKVDVAQYAKERWGLEVKEVSDIYDAVYYFTGHRLSKPQVPPNIRIDTAFLMDDAKKDYANTTAYYDLVLEKLKKSTVDYETYVTLKEALDQAKGILNSSKEALDEGMYYTALSKDFQARIIIRHVDWYMNVQSVQDVAELLNRVNAYINGTERYVSGMEIRGMTMLQAIAAAEERVEQAKDILQDAWKNFYNGDYWDAVGNAAYAYERADTARFWASLGERFAKGDAIERDELKDTARNYIDESSLIATYIESMYGDVVGSSLSDTIQKAEEYYDDGKYSAAIFTAMEARVRGEVFLDTLGIDNVTVLRDKLEQMKEAAKTAIGLAQMKGITPLLAMAYYEFAESYEKGNGIDDIQNAMIFYQYARESAGVFLLKINSSEVTWTNPMGSETVPSTTSSTKATGTKTPSTTSSTGVGITSVCGPGIIALFALLPLLRRRD
ncbi:S16 family serine protease [Thermococcus gammatolerans]|uniref:Archaeal serine protease, Lon protease-like protein (Lon) n=1 Tax=Thermococcus gammatolerans (strain DSM 15229 / JCM 11827 / EJ3) TaxID=593117 RepID=C5A2J4_THEGJ|nr:S16 family serine protease [Thermococcus gammatolerans]ACS34613.1 Archaeal serine protease, Lon protease-like protein (lon) [Thermococcus gammatolerans EJ3]